MAGRGTNMLSFLRLVGNVSVRSLSRCGGGLLTSCVGRRRVAGHGVARCVGCFPGGAYHGLVRDRIVCDIGLWTALYLCKAGLSNAFISLKTGWHGCGLHTLTSVYLPSCTCPNGFHVRGRRGRFERIRRLRGRCDRLLQQVLLHRLLPSATKVCYSFLRLNVGRLLFSLFQEGRREWTPRGTSGCHPLLHGRDLISTLYG